MRVMYTGEQNEIHKLGEVCEGEIIRPTNSRELYLVSDRTAAHPLFHNATDRELLYEVMNPQNIDFDAQWDAMICVTRICDGSWWFMSSATKVEIMNCCLNIEGE